MSIIPKLLALGRATTLSSTGPQRQIDFSMPGPDGQRIGGFPFSPELPGIVSCGSMADWIPSVS
jgi:hypothetical protein